MVSRHRQNPVTVSIMTWALTGGVSNPPLSWEDIHFEAQIQALLYLLGMIQQALSYTLANSTGKAPAMELQKLAATLNSMPSLALLIPSCHQLSGQTSGVDVGNVLQRLAGMLNEVAGYP